MNRTRSAKTGGAACGVYRSRVEWLDTDASGHHHNTAIARFVEAAEAVLMRVRGLQEYTRVAPRVRYEVDFQAPLWFGQEVTTTVVLDRIGASSLTFTFEVWGEATPDQDRQLAASGRFVSAHVPPGRRESVPWPTAWLEALGRV